MVSLTQFCFDFAFFMLKTYEIGNKMHMIHSVALLASPMTRKPVLVSYFLFPER